MANPRNGTCRAAAALMESLWQDVAQAIRSLRQTPRFFVPAAMTLTLGIGANSTVLTLADAVVRRPLAVPDPDREGAMVTLGGIAAGVAGAWVWGRLLASLLYGVDARDPPVFAGATIFISAAAAVAWSSRSASRQRGGGCCAPLRLSACQRPRLRSATEATPVDYDKPKCRQQATLASFDLPTNRAGVALMISR